MELMSHDPPSVPTPSGGYVNALEVVGATRTLFISGPIPESAEGMIPATVDDQCRQIWQHIVACLTSAGMTVANLVHVRTYLSDRSLAAANTAVRNEFLSGHAPALTVVAAGILDERWLVEIEATATD